MKFLGIYPPDIQWKGEPRRGGSPLGLLSVLGELRTQGHEVSFLDAKMECYDQFSDFAPNRDVFVYGMTQEQIKQRVKEEKPDVVGVSIIHNTTWHIAKTVFEAVKRANPEILTVAGGHLVNGAVEYVLNDCKDLDVVVMNEGEATTVELLQAVENGRTLEQIFGIAYRGNGNLRVNNRRTHFLSLDNLADPAFDLMKRELYENEELAHYGVPREKSFLNLMITRGCPRGCDFCTSTRMMGGKVRVLSPERIEALIDNVEKLGFEEYIIEDDEVLMLRQIHPQSFQAYLSALQKTGKPWMIDAGLYYPRITEDFIAELAEAGCYRIFLPIENQSMQIMHSSHKYRELDDTKEAKRKIKEVDDTFRKYGMKYYHSIMTGFPTQTRDMIRQDIDFGKFLRQECGAEFVVFFFTHPYPGADLYDSSGHLVDPNRKWEEHPEYGFFVKPVFPGIDYSVKELEEMCRRGHEDINGSVNLNVGYEWNIAKSKESYPE